jgi:hypothetical protein
MNRYEARQFQDLKDNAPEMLLRHNVYAGRPIPVYGHQGRFSLDFTFQGDRELAKYNISRVLTQCFNAHQCQFYASARNPRNCYVIFSIRS